MGSSDIIEEVSQGKADRKQEIEGASCKEGGQSKTGDYKSPRQKKSKGCAEGESNKEARESGKGWENSSREGKKGGQGCKRLSKRGSNQESNRQNPGEED